MYPTKSMYEYMSEMNRLFPNSDNDIFQTSTPPSRPSFPSPFNHTTNRSSSSTDSTTSPDSFPDMSSRLDYRQPEPAFETPFALRRQRPIVGRKIFDTPAPVLEPTKMEIELSTLWQNDNHKLFPNTPPKTKNFVEQNYSQNVLYELFPTENKGFEFRTPVKNYTASPANTSPNFSPRPLIRTPSVPRYTTPVFQSPHQFAAGPSNYPEPNKMCTFCRKNGETPLVYMTHIVKEKIGNRNVVTCPILRSHVCSTCGATGDNAHTITYCPILRSGNNGQPLQSTTITLKNTRIKSNGRRRY